jgi:hypothetical protein
MWSVVGAEHKVRAIWALTEKLDLSRFEEGIASREGQAGRPCWDPRLLVSVWVYSYAKESVRRGRSSGRWHGSQGYCG